jgi:hypothetical protein
VKLGVSVTRLNEAALLARTRELVARRREAERTRFEASEVSDGERELGAAAGDLRQPDER